MMLSMLYTYWGWCRREKILFPYVFEEFSKIHKFLPIQRTANITFEKKSEKKQTQS